ncbi:ATP-grasp domain-containing protein [Streptomyces sp. NPDC032472]|uniref:ATP-grasp domain-containing protein n=1 Tax=Streptomyces sp. NPDC032472 TaxID=3155018 RepID=UPI0033E35E19
MAIVDAYSTGRFLPAALRQYGMECVHVLSQNPDLNIKVNSDDYVGDVRHDGDVVATASTLREYGVGHVIAGYESGVELVDQLSAELGTRGNGLNKSAARRNKYEMALAMREAGLAHAASFVSSNVDDTIAWAESSAGYPVVLKPISGYATNNVMACSSAEQIRAAHEKIMSSTDGRGIPNAVVLAQEFLAGDEHYVNTVSHDGKHHTVEIWRYYKRRVPGGDFVYDYDEPLAPDDPNAKKLESYVHQVLDALEIRHGAAHTEVMLTARGPVLVECNARAGGGQLPEIITRCFGTNQVELLALSAARPDEFNQLHTADYQLLQHSRSVTLINPRDHSVVPSHEAMAVVRALPTYADCVMTLPAGNPLPRSVDVATQPGLVYLISGDPAAVRADYQTLRQIEQDHLFGDGPL